MPLPTIPSGNVASALGGAYEVANSCRFNDGDSPSMTKTMVAGSTDFAKKFTISVWFKLGATSGARPICSFGSGTSDAVDLLIDTNSKATFESWDGSVNPKLTTNRLFRDHSAWFHIVIAVDTTQATNTNRMKMYINGVQETSFASSTYPAEDYLFPGIGTTNDTMKIGSGGQYNSNYFDGYMSEFVYCDGQVLAPTSFGEYDEDSPTIWKPKDVSGLTFGNAGTYCDFEDSGNLGDDESGNTNDLTENNIDATDQATDTPTNNFCTLNPLFKSGAFSSSTGAVVLSQGNCHLAEATHAVVCGTMAVTRGKYYWEVKMNGNDYFFGVLGTTPGGNASHSYNDNTAYGIYIESSGGNTITAGSMSGSAIYTGNATYMIAIDVDNNKLWCGKDGSWTGDPAAGSGNSVTLGTHEYAAWFHSAGTAGDNSASVNFGGCPSFTVSSSNSDGNGYGNFEYAVQSGFYSLCTKNLAEYG